LGPSGAAHRDGAEGEGETIVSADPTEEEVLLAADQRIKEAKNLVENQKIRIRDLKSNGSDTTNAEALLKELGDGFDMFIRDREILKNTLLD
jgi:hypothetical protein